MAELGSDYVDGDKIQVNSDAMVEAMTLLKDLQRANAIQTVPGGNPDKEEAYGLHGSKPRAFQISTLPS